MSDDGGKVERALRRAGETPGDRWPDEPDEFDPHSLGPGGDPTDPDAAFEVDGETFRAFWGAVVLANVGLFGVTVGPMLWYFRGQTLVGAAMVVVGAIALARTYAIQRRYQRRRSEDDDTEPEP